MLDSTMLDDVASTCWICLAGPLRTAFMFILSTRVSKDSNAAAHSVDSDIFYTVIYLSKIYSTLYFIK